jgi:L-seryl-tRNA(Ser) seleniumtransferase
VSALYRAIPSVDQLLQRLSGESAFSGLPRPLLKQAVNEFLERCRKEISQGLITTEHELGLEALLPRLRGSVMQSTKPRLKRVINAAGVVVHTNLGRSILADEALAAVDQANAWYSNLEFNLESGKRGSRYSLVEPLLCELTGAEAGLVVNNNAAAVLLMLDTLVKGKEVIVSRGELVEIGGSFRIPDVMAKSGAVLREVGATNRTHLSDYESAIGPETGAIMKAHTSNYRIVGFHKDIDAAELVSLAEKYNLPVLEDLGSGNLVRFPAHTGLDEPTVQSLMNKGISAMCFSGDKLLGGPQAGIILGKKEVVDRIKANPLNRALRVDKMTLAALEATLRLYYDPELAFERIPTLRMITIPQAKVKSRASRLLSLLRNELGAYLDVWTKRDASRVGGGASPELDLPTQLVCLKPRHSLAPEALRDRLLSTDPPLIGRLEHDSFCLDPRTLQRGEATMVVEVIRQALNRSDNRD